MSAQNAAHRQWTPRVAIAVLLVALGLTLCACPPPPSECGNGVVEEGESEASCCTDTGCSIGVCGTQNACVDVWTEECTSAGAGACLPNSSGVCREDPSEVPASDCTACGCADADRCEDQVCVDVDTRDAERDSLLPPNDLETPDFFALIAAANTLTTTFDQAIGAHRRLMREDRRASTVLIGRLGTTAVPASHDAVDEGTGIEAKVVSHALDALLTLRTDDTVASAPGFLPTALEGVLEAEEQDREALPLSLAQACGPAEAVAANRTSDRSRLIVVTDAATAHRESCFSPALFPVCTHPHLDGCIERSGARPLALQILSTALALDRLERALLVRIGNQQAFAIDGRLEQTITQWLDLVSNLARPAAYRVELDDGEVVYVRGRPTQARDGYTLLVIEDREPWGLQAFRILWNHAPAQAFFVAEDLTAADCPYRRDGDLVTFDCEDGGAQMRAVIDMATRTIESIEQTPRP